MHTGLSGRDLCPPLQYHLLSLDLPGPPLDVAIRLFGLTSRGFVGLKFAARFLLSRWAEGPVAEASPYCGRGVGGIAETEAGEGADGWDIPTRDLRAGGGESCFLKLDISEEKQRKVSSKTKIAEKYKTADRDIRTHLKWSINMLHSNSARQQLDIPKELLRRGSRKPTLGLGEVTNTLASLLTCLIQAQPETMDYK